MAQGKLFGRFYLEPFLFGDRSIRSCQRWPNIDVLVLPLIQRLMPQYGHAVEIAYARGKGERIGVFLLGII